MTGEGWGQTLYEASTWVLPLLIAIPFHEAAHGFVAHRLGDDTAWRLGRVTFNPLKHIDPFGTIILPFLLFISHSGFKFGYAKPVPVNFQALRNPRFDSVLVAAAGPSMNIALAIASAYLLYGTALLPRLPAAWVAQNLLQSILLNVGLAVFNMLPLPPLDGGRVAVGLLPPAIARVLARVEPYGIPLLLVVLIVLPTIGDSLGFEANIVGWVLYWPLILVLRMIELVSGLPVLALLDRLPGLQ